MIIRNRFYVVDLIIWDMSLLASVNGTLQHVFEVKNGRRNTDVAVNLSGLRDASETFYGPFASESVICYFLITNITQTCLNMLH